MGLEVATFVSGLTAAWPPSTDPKSQGDDHIRLLKSCLQSTFPTASKAFYFPTTTISSGSQILTAADQNKVVMLSTPSSDLTVTLPSLVAGDAGWSCEVIKTSTDTNGIVVSPVSGTITSRVGATASIRVGQVAEPARFFWSGAAWYASKPGVPIGTTINFDGATVPPGFLTADGSAIPAVYIELIAVLGATLKDKRGRVEAGVDAAGVRLTSTYLGTAAVLGAAGGADSNTLDATRIPAHQHDVFLKEVAHTHSITGGNNVLNAGVGGSTWPGGTPGGQLNLANVAALTGITIGSVSGTANDNKTASIGGGAAHANVQPTIVTNKLIRAC